jgi:hypothetical protein
MSIQKIGAYTQYGDYIGGVSIDHHDLKSGVIGALAKDLDIDLKRYFPIAISANYQALQSGGKDRDIELTIVFYAVETSVASNYDELVKAQEPIRLKKFMRDISLDKFLKEYTKRFSFCFASKGPLGEFVSEREFDIEEL